MALHCKCSDVPGELLSKFTESEKPYGVAYAMQTSKCVTICSMVKMF